MILQSKKLLNKLNKEKGLKIFNKIQNGEKTSCEFCENPLKIVINKKYDLLFIGCTNYPNCKFSLPIFRTIDEVIEENNVPIHNLNDIQEQTTKENIF